MNLLYIIFIFSIDSNIVDKHVTITITRYLLRVLSYELLCEPELCFLVCIHIGSIVAVFC